MRTIILTLYCICSLQSTFAQRMPPDQYFAAPLTLNPATTGLTDGDVRASYVQHNIMGQGHSPIYRLDASVDMPILAGILPKGDALGVGLLYQYNDQSGTPYFFRQSNGGLSLAYHKSIGRARRHHLSLAAQGMFTHTRSQQISFGGSSYDTRRSGQRANAGIMYSGSLSRRIAVQAGYSRYHMYLPFDGIDHRVEPINAATAGGSVRLSERTTVFANVYYYFLSYGHATQVNAYIGFPVSKGPVARTVYAGLVYRDRYTAGPYLGLEAKKFRIGLNYNIPKLVSPLANGNNFEASFMYTGKFGLKRNANWHVPTLY